MVVYRTILYLLRGVLDNVPVDRPPLHQIGKLDLVHLGRLGAFFDLKMKSMSFTTMVDDPQFIVLFIVYCYRRASAKTEGDDTEENVFSQEPLGKPPRHYTILAHSTRSRYTRNIWPEPLIGYLWG